MLLLSTLSASSIALADYRGDYTVWCIG